MLSDRGGRTYCENSFLFRSFVLAVSIVSMVYGRENDSVDDSRAANSWHRAVRVDVNDANSSRRVRRKRLFRFASPMLNPHLVVFPLLVAPAARLRRGGER